MIPGRMNEHDVTILLRAISGGDREALDQLVPLVYGEIRRIAARHLRNERSNHTLQPTALANEAYLRLAGQSEPAWTDRVHFLRVASRVIRNVLVDHARARNREKRGGDVLKVTLVEDVAGRPDLDLDILALDQALERFAGDYPEEARVVELQYFGGLTPAEAAELLGVSRRTVDRRLVFARAWLFQQLKAGADGLPGEEA